MRKPVRMVVSNHEFCAECLQQEGLAFADGKHLVECTRADCDQHLYPATAKPAKRRDGMGEHPA